MSVGKVFLVFLFLFASIVTSQPYDYYWRDFYGEIPEDALPAGKDANGKDVYIAQIYCHEYGLFIGTIFQGKPKIEFNCYGFKQTSSLTKILCTKHKSNFNWLPTTSKNLHVDTINTHAVAGGYNAKEVGFYNIGRGKYDGSVHIGPVRSYTPGTAFFYFAYQDKLYNNIESYEVLVYDEDIKLLDARIQH